MRLITLGLLAGFLVCGSAAAATPTSQPPSDASIQQLLQVIQAHKMLDAMQARLDGMMHTASEQALAGQPADAGEQKIIDAQTAKLSTLMKSQLSWDSMEPMYVDIYRKTFTQKEVDDMIAFYKSPSGQSMVAKMPAVMGQTMQDVQGKMTTLMPQLRQISEDTTSQLKAYEANKQNAAAPAPKAK
ncbi:DUF2059 domain-containing protein [Dyella agri]|uniref:DUF2059 domain-containing protein n=1 Tax=Dyella agri TaxID=1926869 RepID=A0ABW8KNA9_9GAMM